MRASPLYGVVRPTNLGNVPSMIRSIGKRIRSKRIERGVSAEALAHALGMSAKSVYRVERAPTTHGPRAGAHLVTLLRIACALDVAPADLLQ